MEHQPVAKVQIPARVNHLQRQSAGSSSATYPLLELQRSIGNQAVQRLILSPYIQTKLQISTPGDPFEREADQMADTVMRMPAPEETTQVQAKSIASQITPLVQREAEQPAEEMKEEDISPKPLLQRVPVAVREDDDEDKVATKVESNLHPDEQTIKPAKPEKDEVVAAKANSHRIPVAVREDDDEEKIATKLETNLPQEVESPNVAKPKISNDTPIQRQTKEDEEEKDETLGAAVSIQRQIREDEREQIQPKAMFSVLSQSTPKCSKCSTASAIQRLCTECESEKQLDQKTPVSRVQRVTATVKQVASDEADAERVQPKAAQHVGGGVSNSIAGHVHALNGRGNPLSATTRAFFEPRFGADFSHVRVHTDTPAVDTAKSINARAFTFGRNIAFGPGEYAPESPEGRHVLAHELTHVLQQSATSVVPTRRVGHSTPPMLGRSFIIQREPADPSQSSGDDPALAAELDEEIKAWEANANQDADLMLRANAARMVLLLKGWWRGKPRPAFRTRDDVDTFAAECKESAKTEMGTFAVLSPGGVEFALTFYPKGFPLTWSGRVQAALTFGIDPASIVAEWTKAYSDIVARSQTLGPEIFLHGLPVPFDDLSRLDDFKLRVSDSKLAKGAVRDYALESVRYMQIKFISSFAFMWENMVNQIAGAVADGTVVPSYLDWKDFVENKQAILRELPARARERLVQSEEEAQEFQSAVVDLTKSNALKLADAALLAGMVGALTSLFGILSAWGEASSLFDTALKTADGSVASEGKGGRLVAALRWALDNDYFSGAAAAWAQNLIQHGAEILEEIAVIVVLGMIPGVDIAVAVYLLLTTARDVVGMLDELAASLNDVFQAKNVGELQKASARLAQILTNGAIFILIVLATEGIGKAAARLRKGARELRAADKTLTAEAAEKKAFEQMSAEERKALERGKAETAKPLAKKFEEFAGACSLGSINCRTNLPDQILKDAGPPPTDFNVPMPTGPFTVQKSILSGVQRGTENLRNKARANRKSWPHFDKALAAAEKQGKDWVYDSAGKPWEVHHVKPVFMGGTNVPENLFPLPLTVHQRYTNWWNSVHRAFKIRFTDVEWNLIYQNVKDVPGSRVPKNPKP